MTSPSCAITAVGCAWALLAGLLGAPAQAQTPAQPQATAPEAVGLSAQRLQRVDDFIARQQAEGKLAGAVTVVARRGQLVSMKAHGFADLASRRVMRPDDIFQIQSMSKPVGVVALLMLLEEGRFLLSDPVARFLPEFANMSVAVAQADAPGGFVRVPARRAITLHDLLTHRAGFAGLPVSNSPADVLMRQARQQLPADGDYTLAASVHNLASVPLDSQPGAGFKYGPAGEVIGRLVEVVAGQPLADFLHQRIFQPLGMVDTGFGVPPGQRHRLVTAYARSADPGLVALPPYALAPRLHSTGGNLFSTPADYLRFCQMLLDGGAVAARPAGDGGGGGTPAGPRLLSRKSVELMTARHVDTLPQVFMAGQQFGLGVAVRTAGGESGLLGSAGAYGWSGGYNTYFRIDPQEQLILMLFAQQAFRPPDVELQHGFHNTVMQAIID